MTESGARRRGGTSRGVIVAYVAISLLFSLATSMIWAINTIFLIQNGGLTIFQVLLVNTAFVLAQMVFEVPTGVIADTIGRKASMLLCMSTLTVSTVLYVITPAMGWGIWGFVVASVLIGLGFTFQTGAQDAWMVDALDATGFVGPKERIFAWGGIAFSAGVLGGSLAGGLLGQLNLVLPYLLRAALLFATFLLILFATHDAGFERRPLIVSTFGTETRRIYDAGVSYGWNSPVIRPLLWISGIGGLFYLFGFYVWAPYLLGLLGKNYIWLLGVVQAASSAAGIVGALSVQRVMRSGELRRDPARVLMWTAIVDAVLAAGIAVVGLVSKTPGVLPAAIAILLWLLWGFIFGFYGPVRQGYINEHIPSAQRATVLSLDSFFGDVGGAVGQPTLGYVAQKTSIQLAWLLGTGALFATAPLYAASGRAARAESGVSAPDAVK